MRRGYLLAALLWLPFRQPLAYHARMMPIGSLREAFRGVGRAWLGRLTQGRRVVRLGAEVLVQVCTPASYGADHRSALARQIYLATASNLTWFTVLWALLSLVLIRIVVVTSISYGLSRYAIEMVVRVLVLELIPLTAALFVAVRYTLPRGSTLHKLRTRGGFDALRAQGLDPTRQALVPSVLAGLFAVITLAAVSGLVSLVLAYLTVYGFSPWGFADYTHTVGRVFNPTVSLIFVLKTLLFGLAVALIPVTTALLDVVRTQGRASVELQGLIRMFTVLLLVEVASLVGNYY